MTATAEAPATSPFERIGGHADLRAIHAADLTEMRAQLPSFLAGWAGGPRDWFEANPGKCMMSAHGGMAITSATAGQWAEAKTRAIIETEVADREIGAAMADVLSRMAKGMARS